MEATTKRIGTCLPLFSLKTQSSKNKKNGTITDGLLFLDWLRKTNQSAWQLLPIHETHFIPGSAAEHVSSPYKGYGIGIDPKYISDTDVKPTAGELAIFFRHNEYWLSDYVLFCALRDYFKTDDWTKWDKGIRNREAGSIIAWKKQLAKEIEEHAVMQWRLHREYEQLRTKAKEHNILLIGDLSYYIPLRSPLTWVFREIFQLNSGGQMSLVSGLPLKISPMYGRQVWGHPLYTWENKTKHPKINSLFTLRLRYLSQLFDMVRIDHANGFFHYGAIDPQNPENDEMRKGPGIPFLRQIVKGTKLLSLQIFVEDAAAVATLQDLRDAMRVLNIQGFRILRYAYDEKEEEFVNEYADLHLFPWKNVAYSTTHDTETLMGFLKLLNTEVKKQLAQKTSVKYNPDDKIFAVNLRQGVISSPSHIVIIPIQDWLLSVDRINIPGTEKETGDTNWQYRLPLNIEDLPLIRIN